ncbi:MAG: hypothetical protein E7321_08165 [Clostridiales bacterium]|nr:hypothetical protein [Clostridiales bacterium]
MKKRILLLLLIALMLLPGAAMAKRPSFGGSGGKDEVQEEKKEKSEAERLEYLKEEARQDTLDKLRRAYEPKPKDYDQNTVCSFGPQFRDVSPRMTDEWYMFTPIDLSEDGVQQFDLIAGNMYVVGELTVTVKAGKVQVDYAYTDPNIEIGREYFTFFPDYESITAEDLEQFKPRFGYGRNYSIEDKLGGDTDVVLFVCNTATFQRTTRGILSYYQTNPDRVEMREAMLDMIGK